jgi:hypothetical protein
MDSQRWQQEQQGRQDAGRGGSPFVRDRKGSKEPDSSLVAYADSRTHAARQHWGPSESFSQGRERETPSRASGHSSVHSSVHSYPASEHYTTAPATPYAQHGQAGYAGQQPAYAAAPRTQPDPYAAYGQVPGREHPGYATQAYPAYTQPAAADPYRTAPPPPTYATPRYFGYFDNQYLVYR